MSDDWTVMQSGTVPPLIAHKMDRNSEAVLEQNALGMAKQLHESIIRLERNNPIWIAVYTLWDSLTEEQVEIRYLLLWIVLEAVFGPNDSREITYRISHRIGFFLASDGKEAREISADVKKGYGLRSKVVHGMKTQKIKEEEFQEMLWKTENIVRRALIKTLLEPDIFDKINSNEREDYLDNIVFSS